MNYVDVGRTVELLILMSVKFRMHANYELRFIHSVLIFASDLNFSVPIIRVTSE